MPSPEFMSLRAAAVLAGGTLACWGGWLSSEGARQPATPPFVDYCVGNPYGRGVRDDGTIHCFGEAGIAASPPR